MTLQNGSLKINEWCSLLTLPSLGWWWLFILSGLTTEFPSDSCLIFIPWFGIQRKKWETAHGDGYHSLMMLGMICSWDHGLPPVFLYSAAARCGWSQEPLPRKKGAGGAGGAGATPSNQKVPPTSWFAATWRGATAARMTFLWHLLGSIFFWNKLLG